ncbi:MAG TPA: DUF4148 domain-containing protein [Trinickia sp.]|jgi:hypothetical protein|nr:DUF4148 domain-containing protein [Trinickia sp.]
MKLLVYSATAALVLAVPLAAYAQSNGPKTRAEVRNELIELEQAGYNPAAANDYDYPEQILAAEARVAAKHAGAQTAASANPSGEGASLKGTYDAGRPVATSGGKDIFFGR